MLRRRVAQGPLTVVCLSRPQNLLVAAELPAERLLAWPSELPPILVAPS